MPSDPLEFENTDELVSYLASWIEGELLREIVGMHASRDLFWSYNEMLSETSDDVRRAGPFHNWVRWNYSAQSAMAIRRELDRGLTDTPPPRSFRMFLGTVVANATLLTREWFMSRADGDPRGWSGINEQWSSISSPDTNHVDPELAQADIDVLFASGERVQRWVTRNLAHRLEDRFADSFQYGDLHTAVDLFNEKLRFWHLVITGKILADLDPPWWEWVMTMPWISEIQAQDLHTRRGLGEAGEHLRNDSE